MVAFTALFGCVELIFLAIDTQPNGIALTFHQIHNSRRRQYRKAYFVQGVYIELLQFWVVHRTAIVDNQVTAQVCFLFVALGVKLVGFCKKLPIYMFGAFASVINFMFGKFRRKTMKRTFV